MKNGGTETLKTPPVFSTGHLLCSGSERSSKKQTEIFHSLTALRKQRLLKKKGPTSNTRPAPTSWYLPDFKHARGQSLDGQIENL